MEDDEIMGYRIPRGSNVMLSTMDVLPIECERYGRFQVDGALVHTAVELSRKQWLGAR